MADLSALFAGPQVQSRGSAFSPQGIRDSAAFYKRRIAVGEAQRQGLSPESGMDFYKFLGQRLLELGDVEGTMRVGAKVQELQGALAAGQQQQFENALKVAKNTREQQKANREASLVPKRSEPMTAGQIEQQFGVKVPAELQDALIEVKFGENDQPVDFQVLSKGGTNISIDNREPTIGGQELSKPTLNSLQQEVIDTGESIARLSQINETFDSRFLQLGTRLQEFGGRMKDFLGTATPEDQALITEFQDFKATALDNLNLTLNQLSGAAVSPQEFKRISASLPNPGSGLFDGDSPTQFMAKTRRAMRDMKLARARANYILAGGGSLEDIQKGRLSLPGMKKIMQDKVNEWDRAGFTKEQIAVKLRETFGDF